MNATFARDIIARRPTKIRATRLIALAAGLLVVACTGKESSSSGESVSSVSGPDAQSTAGRGHLQLTGDATVDTDFAVEQCSVGPAGDGLLNGYHMSARASHGTAADAHRRAAGLRARRLVLAAGRHREVHDDGQARY